MKQNFMMLYKNVDLCFGDVLLIYKPIDLQGLWAQLHISTDLFQNLQLPSQLLGFL